MSGNSTWHIISTLNNIPRGLSLWFIDSEQILAIRHDNVIRVIDNSCPHAGSSLANGALRGYCIKCRSHGIKFDLRTGRATTGTGLSLIIYESRVRDGYLEVKLPEANIS